MAKTPEAKERDPVVAYAKSLGIPVIRMYFGPGINTGWPDDLFLIPGGRPLFLEAKAPGKKPTQKQYAKMALLLEKDYHVNWYDQSDLGILMVQRAYNEALLDVRK